MQVTRRELGGALLASTAALAQTQPPPATPEAELQAARQQLQRNSQALARFDLPAATEPACVFKP